MSCSFPESLRAIIHPSYICCGLPYLQPHVVTCFVHKFHVTSQLYGNYIRSFSCFCSRLVRALMIKKTKTFRSGSAGGWCVVGRRCASFGWSQWRPEVVRNAQKCTVDRVTTRRAAAHQTKGTVVERLTTTALPTSRPPTRNRHFR